MRKYNSLTVVIRDDSPMIFCGDTPSYRRVSIALTQDQMDRIELLKIGTSGEREYYESISNCFLEQTP